jgi:hypothetical protein
MSYNNDERADGGSTRGRQALIPKLTRINYGHWERRIKPHLRSRKLFHQYVESSPFNRPITTSASAVNQPSFLRARSQDAPRTGEGRSGAREPLISRDFMRASMDGTARSLVCSRKTKNSPTLLHPEQWATTQDVEYLKQLRVLKQQQQG